ncbi:hypothetical protein SESBI_45409 [Sesbania bispinosa]|nr:hypothetical protein SESBI_45409 [Sesbania bispinosa]
MLQMEDIEEALKGRIYERATLQEDVKTTLSPTIDEGIDLDVVANNANSSGGNMHVRVSQVIDQDASGSNSLILEEFKLFKPFVKLDDAQIVVLMEAIDVYPHLWKVCKKFSARFQAWMLKTLADMLLFLRNESAISVTHEKEKKFHTLCDEAIQLGFEKSWVNEMRQRVIRRGLEEKIPYTFNGNY